MRICRRDVESVLDNYVVAPRSRDENQRPGDDNWIFTLVAGGHNADSQVIGLDQQVGVVEQDDLGPLHQQEEGELDEQHQGQLPDAADVQEDRAGQQGQQHTVAEILRQRRRERGRVWRRGGGERLHHYFSCKQKKKKKYNRMGARTRERTHAHAGRHKHTQRCGLTSGKWQAMVWLEHRVKPSSAALVRLRSRQRVTLEFCSLATHSFALSLLQVNWRGTTGGRPSNHMEKLLRD